MLTVTDKDLNQHLSEYIKEAQKEPVVIEAQGHPTAVLLSYQHLKRLLDDTYWGQLAQKTEENAEYLTHEESMELLNKFAQNNDEQVSRVLMEPKKDYGKG